VILSAVLLMREEDANQVQSLARAAGVTLAAVVVSSLEQVELALKSVPELLLSFGTSVIVPAPLLNTQGLVALNVHAASPEFPGRDPHHFAVYRQVVEYGATLHYMTAKVDEGPIADVERFDVPLGAGPNDLLRLAHAAGFELIRRLFTQMGLGQWPPLPVGIRWGSPKHTRQDFLRLCMVNGSMTADEVDRRRQAVAMPGYRNLVCEIHGIRFRIDESQK